MCVCKWFITKYTVYIINGIHVNLYSRISCSLKLIFEILYFKERYTHEDLLKIFVCLYKVIIGQWNNT